MLNASSATRVIEDAMHQQNDDRQLAVQLHSSARRLLLAGRLGEALPLLQRAAQAAPHSAEVACDLGVAHLMLRQPDAAVEPLQRAVAALPSYANLHNNLGVAYKSLGRFAEARYSYRRAIESDSAFAPAHNNLGEVMQALGQRAEARRCFERTLSLDPSLVQARLNLANLLMDNGELAEAAAQFGEVLASGANPSGAYTGIGHVRRIQGDHDGSLEAFRQAIAVNPALPEPHYNLGFTQLEFGDPSAALGHVREALRLKPDLAGGNALFSASLAAQGDLEGALRHMRSAVERPRGESECYGELAVMLRAACRPREALACYEKQLETDPHNATALHFVAALRGERLERASELYVQTEFDSYAERFDESLIGQLGYCVPRELVSALHAATPAPATPWDVLDLGCGTGLVGVEIAAASKRLVGIDLSPRMLERARRTGVYSELVCGELMQAITAEHRGAFDIIVAGDVFIYFGDLSEVIPAVARTLRADGLFAFTVETAEDAAVAAEASRQEPFTLALSGRYAHREDYLRALARDTGFEVRTLRKTSLRFEHHRPVRGWLNVWSAPGPA
jgi:predicted TPR repeat methyltransferase